MSDRVGRRRIVVRAAVDVVRDSVSGVDAVEAETTAQDVRAAKTIHCVVTVAALEQIRAAASLEVVVSVPASEGVRTQPAPDAVATARPSSVSAKPIVLPSMKSPPLPPITPSTPWIGVGARSAVAGRAVVGPAVPGRP